MSTDDRATVEVGQTLHGYAGGHRLLAASLTLPREVERLLLVLSDVSGPGAAEGFDGYLTAYPLPGAAGHAVARTWLAPEMPRPGCVWTHTLIIPPGGLDRVVEAGTFLRLFRRPESPEAFASYQLPVSVPVEGEAAPLPRPAGPPAAAVVHALYDEPGRPVVVTGDRAVEFEPLVTHLWRQQWPSLRKAFSFCTGSLAGRTLDARPFDLQVMPWSEARRMSKARPAPVVVTPDRSPAGGEPWVEAAVNDLTAGGGAGLRPLLSAAGRRLPGDRSYFKPLARLHCLGVRESGRELARGTLSVLADTFPVAAAGQPLKQLVLGAPDPLPLPGLSFDAFDLTGEAAALADPGPFAELGPTIAAAAERLWPADPARLERAVCAAAGRPPGPTRDPFLDGVSRVLSPGDLARLGDACPDSLPALVPRAPRLLLSPDAWRGSPALPGRLVDRVQDVAELLLPDAPAVVQAAMDAAAGGVAEALIGVFGETAVLAALDWHAERQVAPPDGWFPAFAARPVVAVRWLSEREAVPPASTALLTSLLNPWSEEVRAAGVMPWVKHAAAARALTDPERYRALAFYLVLGLRDSTDHTFPAVATAFTDFYQAARDGRLPDADWDAVSGLLPAEDWWWAWDRCARMRQGVADRFVAGRWSPDRLFELTDDGDVFGQVFGTLRGYKDGRRFIRRIAEPARAGAIGGHHWQRQFFDGW